jgi:glycosyltransferase involved in cell wall biosynthesis
VSGRRRAYSSTILMMANFSSDTGYAWSNIYRLFGVLAKEFARHGVGSIVSFRRLADPPGAPAELGHLRILELSPYPRGWRELVRLLTAIRSHRVRYVYLTDHASADWRYPLMRLAGVRRILVHNRVSVPSPARVTMRQRGPRGWLKFVYHRLPWFGADRTYAVSDFVRSRLILKARVPERRVVTIMNGIPVEHFDAPPPRQGGGPLRVFTGARATKHKGIHVLIAALARLESEHGIDDVVVEFAGDGPDRDEFEALARRLGVAERFRFLGEIEDTAPRMADADVVVVPSIWGDACPSAVSEGLASGRAVIATAVGGVPEIVGDSGNALLVPADDAGALASAIARLVRDPEYRLELGRLGRARARDALDERTYHAAVLTQVLRDADLLAAAGPHG